MHIDAEVHFWKYGNGIQNPLVRDHKLLQEHFLPEQIRQSLQRNGIDACIAVSAERTELETRFLCELSLTYPFLRGVIGWIDLFDPGAAEKLEELHIYAPIRGYQLEFVQDRFLPESVMLSLAQYQYTLDVNLKADIDPVACSQWLYAHPAQSFILQQAGNPVTKNPPANGWEGLVRTLAKNKNLSCKLSGFIPRGNQKTWKPADFYPFLDILFDAFGIERLLFASDWPFLLLSGMYVQWKSLLEKYTEKFLPEDRDKLFGENARRLYRL